MSEKRSVSRNIAGTFIVQIPNYVFGLIAGIFLTRQLGPEGKGVHTIFITNTQLLVMFLGLNLTGAIQFFVANKKIENHVLLTFSLLIVGIGSVIVYSILFVFPVLDDILLEKNYDTFYFRSYLFVSFLVTNLNSIMTGMLQGHHEFKYVNRILFVNSILNLITFSSLYWMNKSGYFESGLSHVLLLTFCILVLNSFMLLFTMQRRVKPTYKLSLFRKDVKVLFRFMTPSYISVLVNFFNYRLTIWLVNSYEGNEQLGYFSLALNFAQMMLMVTLAINTVLFPYFAAKSDINEAIKEFRFAFKINMIFIFFATSFLIATAPFLIPLFYSNVFEPSIAPVQVLAIGTMFCSMVQVFGHFFGAKDKNWLNTFIYAIALISLNILGITLIPLYGIIGAAWASTCSYFISFILFLLTFRILYSSSVFSLFIITKEDIARLRSFIAKR